MHAGKQIALGITGVVLLLIIICIFWFIGISNNEITLRQKVMAQQKNNEAIFDNTWKIIAQQAKVSDEYKEAFKEIYPQLMAGRYGADGASGGLMLWIKEHNPNFDASLYKKLMTSIEAQRTIFTNNQKMLIDLQREHSTMLKTFPNSIFIGGRGEIKIQIITSDKTEEIFKTGKENDISLGI